MAEFEAMSQCKEALLKGFSRVARICGVFEVGFLLGWHLRLVRRLFGSAEKDICRNPATSCTPGLV